MQTDLSQEHQVWDQTLTVTYQSTRGAGSMVDTLGPVKRRALSSRELAASGGAYTRNDCVLLVPAALLSPGFVPKPADTWRGEEDPNPFTVLEANQGRHDGSGYQIWRLVSRDPIIAFDLRDQIDIERATLSYDASGTPVKAFPPAGGGVAYPALACRVQLTSEDIVDERLLHGFAGTHLIYVAREIVVTGEDRVKWVSGGRTYYLDIERYHNGRRIDELPILEARLKV
jgi:hypothetical protein